MHGFLRMKFSIDKSSSSSSSSSSPISSPADSSLCHAALFGLGLERRADGGDSERPDEADVDDAGVAAAVKAADRGLDATRLASVESLCCAVSGGGDAEAHAAASPSCTEWLLAAIAGMAIACEETDEAQACARSVGLATQRCSD
jgi:hypothetical protein